MTDMLSRPISVFHPTEIAMEPYLAPMDYIRRPFAVAHPIIVERGRRIQTPDVEEGIRRMLPDKEGFWAGTYVVGPDAGEAWHTHLSYYDVVYYVISGLGRVWWRSGGIEDSSELVPGSFFYIAPSATHQWLNIGTEDLRLVSMIHFHDFSRTA